MRNQTRSTIAQELARQLDEQGRPEMATAIRLSYRSDSRPNQDHDPETISEEVIELIRQVAATTTMADFMRLRNAAKLILAGLER